MATAADLIKGSMRLIGAIAAGETPSASETADGLTALNDMIDSWSNEHLLIPSKVIEKFDLVASTASYTMGSSGDFNTTRPLKIDLAYLEEQSSSPVFEMPIEILNQKQYGDITTKTLTSTFPTKLFVEYEYPLVELIFWPVPTATDKVVLHSWKPLTTYALSSTTVSVAPGYSRALRYNLAIELAPEFGKEPPASVVAIAMESKESIKRMNIQPHYLEADPGVMGRNRSFNYLTGE